MQHVHHVFKVECYVGLWYFFILYIQAKKQLSNKLKVFFKGFFNIIVIDVLNKNQALSEIKKLEKFQHFESAQRVPRSPSNTLTISTSLYSCFNDAEENLCFSWNWRKPSLEVQLPGGSKDHWFWGKEFLDCLQLWVEFCCFHFMCFRTKCLSKFF